MSFFFWGGQVSKIHYEDIIFPAISLMANLGNLYISFLDKPNWRFTLDVYLDAGI
jgi:hypothetical protein